MASPGVILVCGDQVAHARNWLWRLAWPDELQGPSNGFNTTDTTNTTDSMLEKELSETLLDSFFFVYNEFGYGFLESVYANSLATELEYRGVGIERQVPFELYHRGKEVGRYRCDLLVENRILIEVKSSRQLVEADAGLATA